MVNHLSHNILQPHSQLVIAISWSDPFQEADEQSQLLDSIRTKELKPALPFGLLEKLNANYSCARDAVACHLYTVRKLESGFRGTHDPIKVVVESHELVPFHP